MPDPAFALEEISEPDLWCRLVASSKQGKIFSSSAFLDALGMPCRRFVVTCKGKPLALFCAVENESRTALIAPNFTPYQGILFLDQAPTLARTRGLDEFRISEFLIGEITRRYRSATIRFSWTFSDIRPFQWHNFSEDESARFRVTPYYTAILGLQDRNEEELLANLRPCRRQELRKANDLRVVQENDIDKFRALYKRTFLRQNITLDEEKLALVTRICKAAIEHQFGRLTACYRGEEIAGMALFAFDDRRGYYLFGANDPEFRNSGSSTKLIWANIRELRAQGLEEVDFVGVNSPHRGDFKLSFNPELRVYFQVEYASRIN